VPARAGTAAAEPARAVVATASTSRRFRFAFVMALSGDRVARIATGPYLLTRDATNRTTAFLLLIQKDEAGSVVQLQIALDRPTFDTDGQALVTPAVATADEFESAVNALQAELDTMRQQGRRLLGGRN
jgi:hypothetical protein